MSATRLSEGDFNNGRSFLSLFLLFHSSIIGSTARRIVQLELMPLGSGSGLSLTLIYLVLYNLMRSDLLDKSKKFHYYHIFRVLYHTSALTPG